jgi:hypothetical protein
MMADEVEKMVAAIERAAAGFDAGAAALVAAVTQSAASMLEATDLAANVDAVRREILSAVHLVCAELRSTAVCARTGNTNIASRTASEPENEYQLVYTLNPLLWWENGEVRRVPAYARVELPKTLLLVALRHQHVDYLNARRVQTLIRVHGTGLFQGPAHADDPRSSTSMLLPHVNRRAPKPMLRERLLEVVSGLSRGFAVPAVQPRSVVVSIVLITAAAALSEHSNRAV